MLRLLLLLLVALASLSYISTPAEAIAYTGCPGTLTNVAFTSSTFSLNAGCALTIDGGTATDLTVCEFVAHPKTCQLQRQQTTAQKKARLDQEDNDAPRPRRKQQQ